MRDGTNVAIGGLRRVDQICESARLGEAGQHPSRREEFGDRSAWVCWRGENRLVQYGLMGRGHGFVQPLKRLIEIAAFGREAERLDAFDADFADGWLGLENLHDLA